MLWKYCKFRNFYENFIFTNSVKRHICDVKILLLGHVLPLNLEWCFSIKWGATPKGKN